MKEIKLHWKSVLDLWLWHQYPDSGLVSDEEAFLACLRVREFVEYAIWVLEAPLPADSRKEE